MDWKTKIKPILISSAILIAAAACTDQPSKGGGVNKSDSDIRLLSKDLPLLNFEDDCKALEGIEHWQPRLDSDKRRLADADYEFLATPQAMEMLLDNYDFDFRISGNMISKLDPAQLYNLRIDLGQLEVKKACIQVVNLRHRLGDPNPDQLYPVVQMTLIGDNTAHGAVRYMITGERSYYIQLRSGRNIGSMGSFYKREMSDIRDLYPEKDAKFSKADKEKIDSYLALMGFEPSAGELKTHFFDFKYRASIHNFPRRENGIYYEDDVILALSALKAKLIRQPLYGPDATWTQPSMERVEKVHAMIGLLHKFADRFSSITPSWYQVTVPGVEDLPRYKREVASWHYFHFLLDNLPSFDFLIVEDCYSRFSTPPHVTLFCSVLKEEIEAKDGDYQAFLNKKFSKQKTLRGYGQFLNRKSRARVVEKYLALSAQVIEKLWAEKRDEIAEDIAFNQDALQTTRNMRNAIDSLLPLLISMKIMELQAAGYGFIPELISGDIDEAEYQERLRDLTSEKRAEAVQLKDEFMELRAGAFADLDEADEMFVDSANQLNPFDEPYTHM
ncbi:MAG: hypothetical protein HRT45_04875 [Bdellovibrionales bacterium]|nr:hypothetical protein [Bdellovibrionales bacterium]